MNEDDTLPLDEPLSLEDPLGLAQTGDGGLNGGVSLEQARFLLEAAGPVGMVLLVLSIIALAVILMKIWQFARLRIGSRGFIDEALNHWRKSDPDRTLQVLRRTRNPIARVMETAVQGRSQGNAEDTVREEVARVGAAQLENLRSHLRVLEVIGTLSPLLGLLGTVMGMITAFQQLEQAGSRVNPAVLSGGIWEALLTTAAGLIIAIPVVMALNWLERRVERLRHAMEDAVTRIFTTAPARLTPAQEEAAPLRRAAQA